MIEAYRKHMYNFGPTYNQYNNNKIIKNELANIINLTD